MNALTGSRSLTISTLLILLVSATLSLFYSSHILTIMPGIAYGFMLGWLAIAIICALFTLKDFVSGFLLCTFAMMIAWRIAALYHIEILTYTYFVSFITLLINFLYCAYLNINYPERYLHKISLAGWQLVFMRLYIGFDFIPHFTEKLFAGTAPHMLDVVAFINLNVPHANFFVWLAGLCEFGAAIALCLGFFMRIGAIGAVLYLLIATYLGHHFLMGFIWANPGGGWEFATMWMILILSFAVTGSYEFSIDQRLNDKYQLPNFIKKLM